MSTTDPNTPKPDFFLVGAPKAGTTALCDQLRQHPEIHISTPKEPHFFDTDIEWPDRPIFTEAEYQSLFERHRSRVCGEGTTYYLVSESAPRGILQHNPRAKILVVLRKPTEAIWSLYQFARSRGSLEDSLEDVLYAERARTAACSGIGVTPAHFRELWLELYRYSYQVSRYINTFGRDSVKVILFEDLKEAHLQTYRGILNFLGVDTSFKPRNRTLNKTGTIRSESLKRFARRPPALVRRIAYSIPNAVRRPLYKGLLHLNTSYTSLPAMKPDLEAAIRSSLRADIKLLEEIIDRDLRTWR